MIHTWDWLFGILPRDEDARNKVLDNIKTMEYTRIQIRDFVLQFDFETGWIYCDCVEEYTFKHKVIPGKVSFEYVVKFLSTQEVGAPDEECMHLLFK